MPDVRAPGRPPAAAVAIAVAVGVLTFAFRYLANGGFANDHFVHVARAQQMLLGGWPVRDFVDPGMPLTYLLSAGALWLSGNTLLGETILTFAGFATAAGLTFFLAWTNGIPLLWSLAAVAFQVLMMPRSYSYLKLLALAVGIAACWRFIAAPSGRRAWLVAAAAVAAFLLRHDLGLFVGLAGLVTVLGGGGPQRLRLTLVYAGAALVLALPWAAYVHIVHGLDRYFRSAVEFSRTEAERTRASLPAFRLDPGEGLWLPPASADEPRPIVYVRWRPGLTDAEIARRERALGLERIELHEGRTWRYHPDLTKLDAVLADPAVEDTNHVDEVRPRWWWPLLPSRWRLGSPGPGLHLADNARAFLFYLFWVLPLVVLIAAAVVRGEQGLRMAVVAILALLADAAFLRNPLEARLPDAVMPQALLIGWSLAWGFARRGGRGEWLVPAATGALVLALGVAVHAAGNVPEHINRIGGFSPTALRARASGMTTRLRAEYDTGMMPSRASHILIPVFDYLKACTEPSDRWMYVGFGGDLYFYSRRGFAGGHVSWIGSYYSADDEQRLTRERLLAERVPIVVVQEEELPWFRMTFPIVAAHVDGRYRRIGEVNLGYARGLVLVDPSIAVKRTYAPLDWPCFR